MNLIKNRHRSRRNSVNVMVNSEKWRNYGRRISKRGNEVLDSDESGDDEPKYNEIKDWVQDFFSGNANTDKNDQDVEVQLTRKQTIILSTLVPDELLLLDKFDSSEPKRFVGVLLMADVSGYTALSEKYNNTGKGGTYRLTVTLNTYLGSLVELIYSHGGDILKFAGDAFLALWKTDKRSFLSHTIHTAIACALIIQHSYSTYETDVKVSLRVKLAISAGNLMFAPIGRGIDMNYVIFGLPVIEAKAAESVCASGEVKLTPNAWGHCYSRNYDHHIHEDGHVTIKSILYDPHETNVNKPFVGFGSMIKQAKLLHGADNLPDLLDSKNISPVDAIKRNEALSIRKKILLAEERHIGSEIRKFMIRPVLTQIDAHQPLEYLTEMRQVSILFMTLKPRDNPFAQLITIVNNAYQITCEIVYKSMGCVNKIILFDKDVMILVIFGLRGFKHESEAQAALKCAYSIKKSVSTLDGVMDVSIGVTTGQVYCGVIGHPLRREFTVIGAVVNKAARLMCKFPNKITCDEATFVKSKMSSNGFTLQPNTELKGIGYPGKLYEYTEDIRAKELYDIPMTAPLLSRNDEIDYYKCWLADCKKTYRDFDGLLLVGENRIGKTRLLEWMARYARNEGFHVTYLTLSSIHSASPYLALSQIINQILDIEEPIVGFDKEEKIVQLLKVYNEDLCYLNNILKVRFAYNENINSQNESQRKEKSKLVFSKVIDALTETQVIFLDDLQNLDSFSWEFISSMFCSLNIFIVMTVTRGKFSSVQNWLYTLFINDNVRKMILGPLPPSLIPALACQILDVDGVPKDLCDTLATKCNGMPGVVESFLIHLFCNGALDIIKVNAEEIEEWYDECLQFPDPVLLHPQAIDLKYQQKLDELIEADDTGEINVCTVTRKEELDTDIDMQNLDALIMIQIDSLTPYQQLLLKIASVIGNILSRDLLENIMYENNPIITAKAIKRLFAMRILACAHASSQRSSRFNISTTMLQNNENLNCECVFDYNPDDYENLPKYAFCKVMKFKNRNSRKTCYELLPINQKKEFHSRIVNYLENNPQKCPHCGGTVMVVQSLLDLPQQECEIKRHNLDDQVIHPSDESDDDSFESQQYTNESRNINSIENKSRSCEIQNLEENNSETEENAPAFKTTRSDSVLNQQKSRKSIFGRLKNHVSILKTKTNNELEVPDAQVSKKVIINNVSSGKSVDAVVSLKVFDKLRDVMESKNINDWHKLGVIDSEENINDEPLKIKERNTYVFSIEKGISQVNVTKCTCADLFVAIYEQLIYHALQAEMKIKAIHFMIVYSYLNLVGNNLDVILPKLYEAENMCNSENLDKYTKKQYLGKIYAIRAATCILSGKPTAAKMELDRAFKTCSINLDKVTDILQFKSIVDYIKMKHHKYRLHALGMKSDSVFCLNVAYLINSSLGEEKYARLSAIRALQIIQEVECNFVDICDSYSNAIQAEINRGMADSTSEIEEMAFRTFTELSRPIKMDELFALGKFFMECFRARMARGRLSSAIRSGFRVLTISRFLQADNISLDVVPDLFYVLLSRKRIQEAMDVLQSTICSSKNKVSQESETWYFAMCIDLILDAGFQKESPIEITRFAEFSITRGRAAGPGRRRLVTGLWTYWLRANSDKKAKMFESEALIWVSNEGDDGSLTTLLSSLRLAEGMLESLARKVDDLKKVVDLMELRSIADRELTRLETDTRVLRAIYPRWIRLRGNTLKLSGRQSAAINCFNQAMEEARRINNRLEEALARACLSNPVFWIQHARRNCFLDWRPGIEHANASWHQIMYRITITRT